MKKSLLMFVATVPLLVLSMEREGSSQIKIYELNTLKQRYTELLPLSDGKFYKGWGQEQVGRGFIYGSGLAGAFDSSCYQPSITDITAANLLHYYQVHEDKINQLIRDTAPLNNAIVSQNGSVKNKMDALRTEYDATTARHEARYTDCYNMAVRNDHSHMTNITNLKEDNRAHHETIEVHRGKINTLQQNMQDYNRATGQITQLQENIDAHTVTIEHQENQIDELQKDLNRLGQARVESETTIEQFITGAIRQHNKTKDEQLGQLLKDVALLQSALDNKNAMSYGKNNNLFTKKELTNTYNMAYVLLNSNFDPKKPVSLNRLFSLIKRMRPGHQSSDPIEQNLAYFAYMQEDEEEVSYDMCSKLRIVVLFNQLNRYLQENNHHHPKKDDYYLYLKNQDDSSLNKDLENKSINNFKLLTHTVNKTCLRRGNHLKSSADKAIETIKNNKK